MNILIEVSTKRQQMRHQSIQITKIHHSVMKYPVTFPGMRHLDPAKRYHLQSSMSHAHLNRETTLQSFNFSIK